MIHYHPWQTRQAAQALKEHKILLLPTDTVYGVGVVYGDLADLERIKHIKHRPETKAIPVMASSLEMIEEIALVDERTKKIAEAFLPGALTLILPLKKETNRAFFNGLDTGAFRIPDKKEVLETIDEVGKCLFVSSANVSGQPSALNAKEAAAALPNADGILEGICENKMASTILDCTSDELKVLRPGPVALEDIEKLLY